MVETSKTTIIITKDALKHLKAISALEETTLSALLTAIAEDFVEKYHQDKNSLTAVLDRARELSNSVKKSRD